VRVAVVDIGTNSTRLLVADVTDDGDLTERERRTKVTRLGDRLGETGVLSEDAMGRVLGTVREYQEVIDSEGVDRAVAVLTSAVRDAANGEDFLARVRA
jgi:exopolyphosphatase / guanosine-5'-triphosphate,3'-diphosphate pyrophosphatase